MVIVKVGKPTERVKPGNRGKRDSQILLLHYLNRVHFDAPMSPMELEIYHQMRNVIGIDPAFYEYIFTVDADTVRKTWSFNKMKHWLGHLVCESGFFEPVGSYRRWWFEHHRGLRRDETRERRRILVDHDSGETAHRSPIHIWHTWIGLRVLHLASPVEGFRKFIRLCDVSSWVLLSLPYSHCRQGPTDDYF